MSSSTTLVLRESAAATMDRLRSAWDDLNENPYFSRLRNMLPIFNYISIHWFYFIFTCILCSLIFWGSSNPDKSISYVDSLYLAISAMTEAGLNTVNLSQMTLFQQILLFILIEIGSPIWVSISTILVRRRAFEKRFEHVIKRHKELRRMRRKTSFNADDRMSVTGRKSLTDRFSLSGSRRDVNNVVEKEPEPDTHDQGDVTADAPEEHYLGLGKLAKREAVLEDSKREPPSSPNGTISKEGDLPDQSIQRRISRRSQTEADCIRPVLQYAPQPVGEHRRVLNFAGVGAHPHSTSTSAYRFPHANRLTNRSSRSHDIGPTEVDHLEQSHYPSYLTRHTTGRNAQFYGLSKAERDHLGGVEYRAIELLAWVVPLYFFVIQFFACVGLAAWMAHNKADVALENGINPWWLGVFNGGSAFNNSGMSLLDANMIPFQTSIYPLVTMGFLILAGNTAYPLFLRLILWTMLTFLCLAFPSPANHAQSKATLRFILKYPRRVYTTLFPSTPTWWLLFMLIVLNGFDWVFFELLNLNNPKTDIIPANYRALDGLFQALAVRSGGFYVVAITDLRIGLQFLYVVMMYISVYPVVITMRHSNVYEERSLGIYAEDEADTSASNSDVEPETSHSNQHRGHGHPDDGPKLGSLAGKLRRTLTQTMDKFNIPASKPQPRTPNSEFVRQQIRGQLAHDLWWLTLAIFIITCIESAKFDADPATFSVFNIIFEIVSAYGCVGISTGLPAVAYSFSGAWSPSSKLILCAVMLRGRHRGLPVALDRAVRLPDDGQWGEEDEVAERDFRRSLSWRVGERGGGVGNGNGGGEMGDVRS